MFGTAGPAVAEEGDATQLEKVEITGTRIRRVDAETASPIYTIDRATITATGAQTVGQFLQDIPSISGAATNPQPNPPSRNLSKRGLNFAGGFMRLAHSK